MIKNLAVGGGSNKLLLVFALVLGLTAAVLVGVYLSSLNDNGGGSKSSTATVPVVVAAQDIPAATTITAEMLVVKAIPADLALVGAYTDSASAVGQVSQTTIQAGEQVTPTKVTSTGLAVSQFGTNTPLSAVIPAGMRAIAVVVSDVASAGGLVRAGDYVDLIHQTDQDGNVSSCFVLQDVQVVAVGQTLAQPDAATSVDAVAGGATTTGVTTVTVAVSPGDASILAAAQQGPSSGSVGTPLWMALRPFGEHGVNSALTSCGIPAAVNS